MSSFSFRLSPFPLRLSQGHLNLLATCPRKFQHTYLEQLATPDTAEQQERSRVGARFHLLMQQWQLGLPVQPFVQENPQLGQWLTDFIQAAPRILTLETSGEVLQHSEHERTLEFQGYLLTVIYDLLLASHLQAQILDWKTYPRPQKTHGLLQNWQTRLYLFVLAETSCYQPEQLSMTYWFFQGKGGEENGERKTEPQSLRIHYDRLQHQQTRQDLTHLLNQLTHWLEGYQQGESLPKLPLNAEPCQECRFAARCDRATSQHPPSSFLPYSEPFDLSSLPNLADIQEVPL
jgi:hypothetical protein